MLAMRWLLIDKFTAIRKGEYASAVRGVTRSEGALVDDFPAFPVMPPTLLMEMMAQVGGVLTGATIGFSKEVVLAKISQARFFSRVTPPALLTIEARLAEAGDDLAVTECRVLQSEAAVAEAVIFFGLFSQLDGRQGRSVVFSTDFMESFAIPEVLGRSPAEEVR